MIGAGPGDESMLAGAAKSALNMARRILNTRDMPLAELASELSSAGKGETAVLVSGDCGFFSVAKTIIRDHSGIYEIEVIPGISSIQYFCAKLKTSYDDAVLISLHGRNTNIVSKVAYAQKVIALTGGENGAGDICRTLLRHGLGGVKVSVGERLSYPDERILTGSASDFTDMDFDNLSVICIENPSAADPHIPLGDGEFIRGSVPMTKEEIRWLSIQKLGASPGDIIFDIGAGTGSVSVELARKAFDGFVYAIEAKEEACVLVRENAAKHGAFNLEVIHGEAPNALDGLPVPDKAFIGGSSGNMGGILERLISLNPSIRIVANAITIQTLNQIIENMEKCGITHTDIVCVNIAKSKKTGGYDIMTAQNPVYIASGQASASPLTPVRNM